MSSDYVYMRPQRILFVRARGSYLSASRQAWSEMFAWLDANNIRHLIYNGYGLRNDDPRDVAPDQRRYDAGIAMPQGFEDRIPENFSVQMLPGGAYVRKRHIGKLSEIKNTITELRHKWSPSPGAARDPRRPLIEIFYDDPALVPDGQRRIDICWPVAAQDESDPDRDAA